MLHLNACRRKQQEQQNQQSEANDDQEDTDWYITQTNKITFLLERETRYNLCQWIKQRVW